MYQFRLLKEIKSKKDFSQIRQHIIQCRIGFCHSNFYKRTCNPRQQCTHIHGQEELTAIFGNLGGNPAEGVEQATHFEDLAVATSVKN